MDAVNQVASLISREQLSERAACARAGVPLASYQRWRDLIAEGGSDALAPQYGGGRPAKFTLSSDEAKALRKLNLIHDSSTFAIEEFLKHPDCRPETRESILNEVSLARRERRYTRWPISMQRAAYVTKEERAQFRGASEFECISFSPRKGMFYTDKDGKNTIIYPHTVWSMDDYSTNQPYIIVTEAGDQRLGRQVLACQDYASDAWLGVDLIGRERDAYRAEDIVRFILRNIEAHGTMPRVLLLERGRWESSGIHGLHLGKSWDQGGLGARYAGVMWGGLDALFNIVHGFSSRHKAALESSFNMLQTALAHSGTDIGRFRGEFERATRDMLRVQAGTLDPVQAGFLTQDQSREAHWQAMQLLNGRGKHRAHTGTVEVPDDLLAMHLPSDLRPLPDSERWRFLPVKRRATIGSMRSGFIQVTVEPYKKPFLFQMNGLLTGGEYWPNGYTVLVAFDPGQPSLGMYVANGETGAANRQSLGVGEYICTAPYAEDVAAFSLRKGGYADSSKKKANASARTAFASINPLGRRGLAVTAQHTGEGDAVIHRTGEPEGPEPEEPVFSRMPAKKAPLQNSITPLPADIDALETAARDALGF